MAFSAAAAARVAARVDEALEASSRSSSTAEGGVAASVSGVGADDRGNMWKGWWGMHQMGTTSS